MTTTGAVVHDDRRTARWQRLAEAGLVDGDPADVVAPATPWMIAALAGAAAWFAALFLLVFLGVALGDVLRKPVAAIATGVVVCALAGTVLRSAGERAFLSQLGFAFSLAGQALVVVGIAMASGRDETWRWWLFAAFEAALVVLVPHGGHRVLATLAAALATLVALWVASLSILFLPLALVAFVAIEWRVVAAAPHPGLWQAVATGLALSLVGAFVHAAVPGLWRPEAQGSSALMTATRATSMLLLVSACAAAGWIVARDASRSYAPRNAALSAAALAAMAIVAAKLPAVAASIAMLVMAFAAGQRVLMGLAIASLVGALAHYYYRLDTTLLDKSLAWLAIGLGLLIARAIVMRLLPSDDPDDP